MSSTLTLEEFLSEIKSILGHELDPEQEKVIRHGEGPLWVIAGPGSGKTEVLVLRALKLMFVDGINPRSIVLTTFTEKAAKNLMDRITSYALRIVEQHPELQDVNVEDNVNVEDIRVGTLHGLCNDIMFECKYPEYENYRLLDDIEQKLFIYEHVDLVKDEEFFRELFGGTDIPRNRYSTRWDRTSLLVTLFNRIVEDLVDVEKMKRKGSPWDKLASAYESYRELLEFHGRCDFAHLQKKFLDFLNSALGKMFLKGNPENNSRHPGIVHVLVDEYQDTNPIQERIYFKLASNTHNLTVVGDDDQALYRFRGGTVECMVNFGNVCQVQWGAQPEKRFLNSNYRSHPKIVEYYDRYINSFPIMNLEGARVKEKPSLQPRSGISGDYFAVAYIHEETIPKTADKFAQFVKYLLENNIVKDPSQCVLLIRSVKENNKFAGHFARKLRENGIDVYNPRSKNLLEQEEIQLALGAFVSIIDHNKRGLAQISDRNIRRRVSQWFKVYSESSSLYPDLVEYVDNSIVTLSSKAPGEKLNVTILEILYRILAHEPFKSWINDPEKSYRLAVLTKIFESYSNIPYRGEPGSNRGTLWMSSWDEGTISLRWRLNFYYALVGFLESEGGLNEPEIEDMVVPIGKFPIMTIHQAKGLEFPFVFVYRLCDTPSVDAARLEELLWEFRQTPITNNFNAQTRAAQDMIRLYYVAYSRAKYALIHLVPKNHTRGDNCLGFPEGRFESFRRLAKSI